MLYKKFNEPFATNPGTSETIGSAPSFSRIPLESAHAFLQAASGPEGDSMMKLKVETWLAPGNLLPYFTINMIESQAFKRDVLSEWTFRVSPRESRIHVGVLSNSQWTNHFPFYPLFGEPVTRSAVRLTEAHGYLGLHIPWGSSILNLIRNSTSN